jgi:hypothetical protein
LYGLLQIKLNKMNSEREAQREYYVLREMVTELETDIIKFASGNNTAGTRIRKTMQDVKNAAQRIRIAVQEERTLWHSNAIHSNKKGATKVTPFFISSIST